MSKQSKQINKNVNKNIPDNKKFNKNLSNIDDNDIKILKERVEKIIELAESLEKTTRGLTPILKVIRNINLRKLKIFDFLKFS